MLASSNISQIFLMCRLPRQLDTVAVINFQHLLNSKVRSVFQKPMVSDCARNISLHRHCLNSSSRTKGFPHTMSWSCKNASSIKKVNKSQVERALSQWAMCLPGHGIFCLSILKLKQLTLLWKVLTAGAYLIPCSMADIAVQEVTATCTHAGVLNVQSKVSDWIFERFGPAL